MSATLPIESAIRAHHIDDWDLELDGRERDRHIEEELAWLIRFPGDYVVKADSDIFAQIVMIAYDGLDDKIGRIRDLLGKDMRRVAEQEAGRT